MVAKETNVFQTINEHFVCEQKEIEPKANEE